MLLESQNNLGVCAVGTVDWSSPKQLSWVWQKCTFIKTYAAGLTALYATNWMILFWLSYTTFLIWPLFRGQGRNPYKNFVGFLVDLVTPKDLTPKRHFEIYWPLASNQNQEDTLIESCTILDRILSFWWWQAWFVFQSHLCWNILS